ERARLPRRYRPRVDLRRALRCLDLPGRTAHFGFPYLDPGHPRGVAGHRRRDHVPADDLPQEEGRSSARFVAFRFFLLPLAESTEAAADAWFLGADARSLRRLKKARSAFEA